MPTRLPLFLLVVAALATALVACEPEDPAAVAPAEGVEALAPRSANTLAVCHNGRVVYVNPNALAGHRRHGDPVDADGDGYFDAPGDCGAAVDCDDADPAVNPGVTEQPCNGLDDDCDPATGDQAAEICDNGIDDDCDGDVDAADADCGSCSDGTVLQTRFGPYAVVFATPGTYTMQGALNACAALVTPDGCDDWQLLDYAALEAHAHHFSTAPIPGVQPAEYWVGRTAYRNSVTYDFSADPVVSRTVFYLRSRHCACERAL